jgi:hypothetical protein
MRGVRNFDHQMFLAMHDGGRVGQLDQAHARVRVLGGHGFVPESMQRRLAVGLLITRVSSKAAGRKPSSGNLSP